MDDCFEHGRRFAIAIHVDDLAMPTPIVLKHAATQFEARRDSLAEFNVCMSFWLESAALRGALKFFNALSTPASPRSAFATWEETERWAIERLAAVGLTPG